MHLFLSGIFTGSLNVAQYTEILNKKRPVRLKNALIQALGPLTESSPGTKRSGERIFYGS